MDSRLFSKLLLYNISPKNLQWEFHSWGWRLLRRRRLRNDGEKKLTDSYD